jgi:RNA polymerase sigma-70 factor (sigma-E family)
LDLLGKKTARTEFERFVARELDGLRRTAFLITWDAPEAEDLTQECLLRIAKRWPKVRAMDHQGAYARRTLVNLALDGSVGRRRRRGELEVLAGREIESAAHNGAREQPVSLETRDELLQAISSLPIRQRATLVLRFFEDLSEAQTAELLGCSRGTVKSTTARALERVRERLIESSHMSASDPSQLQGGPIDDRSA